MHSLAGGCVPEAPQRRVDRELQGGLAFHGCRRHPVTQIHGRRSTFAPELVKEVWCSCQQAPGNADNRAEAALTDGVARRCIPGVRLDLGGM